MKNEILTAIDKIEKDLLNENYTQYLKKMHNLQVASDRIFALMDTINKMMKSYEEDIPEK